MTIELTKDERLHILRELGTAKCFCGAAFALAHQTSFELEGN